MHKKRPTLLGIGLSCLAAAAMIAWPLFGNPPYGFYAPMKWVVAFASGAGAWAVWSVSKALLPLCVLLVASGGVELLGKMRREQWVPFNWASLVLLGLASVVCFVAASRKPDASGPSTEIGD
jgi:hypothetical protein